MNLVRDPWIPVVGHDGKSRAVSLMEVFLDGEEIRDLAVNPVQRISIMRLLICIAQAALDGPEDEEDWLGCRQRIPPAAKEYLEKWMDRFELYGEHAFLQVPGLEVKRNATLDKLDFGLSAGSNHLMFDHGAHPEGRSHSDAWSALMVLTYQCFSPGGLVGSMQWGGETTTKTSEHAPGVEGSSLHTLLRGHSLYDSIHLNMLTKEIVRTLPYTPWGRPVWELSLVAPSAEDCETATASFLGRLVPVARAIYLESERSRFTLANGLRYPKLPEARDVMGTVVMRNRGGVEQLAYVAVDLARHPWRELCSILTLTAPQSTASGPLALGHLQHSGRGHIDIWTGGLSADKGKVLDVGEWVFGIPVAMLNAHELQAYSAGVSVARQGDAALRAATASYAAALKSGNSYATNARGHYWSCTDSQHDVLIRAASNLHADLNTTWYPIVKQAMLDAYERTCPHKTPRQIQAYAQGLQKLQLKKLGGDREPRV